MVIEDVALVGMALILLSILVVAFLASMVVRAQNQKEDIQEIFEGDKYRIEFRSENPFIPDSVTTVTVTEVRRNREGTVWCKVVDEEGCVSHLTQEDLLFYYLRVREKE